jgi:hypothetical protein
MFLQRFITRLVGDIDDLSQLKLPRVKSQPRSYTERELLALESKIGAELFGPIPAGRRREFFCLDENNWMWYEEWLDELGKQQSATVRYELHGDGVLKIQEGARYSYLEGAELENFIHATSVYHDRVLTILYKPLSSAA